MSFLPNFDTGGKRRFLLGSSVFRRYYACAEPFCMLVIAPVVSAVCAVTGLYLSYYLDTASGGMVVLTQGVAFTLVYFFSPSHGLVGTRLVARRRRRLPVKTV